MNYKSLLSGQDYYSGGMVMPERSFAFDFYRFGAASGQEKDNDISGIGNSYTAEYWQYDSRLSRRWNLDPAFAQKPWMSSYHSFSNKFISNIDPNGANDGHWITSNGTSIGDDGRDDNNLYTVESSTYGSGTIPKDASSLRTEYDKGAENLVNKATGVTQGSPPQMQLSISPFPNRSSSPTNDGPAFSTNYDHPSYSLQSNSSNNLPDAMFYTGVALDLGEGLYFNKITNTWMGKDYKIRFQDWGGNGTTGGMNKYAKPISKTFGRLGNAAGAYSSITTFQDYQQGQFNSETMLSLQLNNSIQTLAPPIVALPFSVGDQLGKTYSVEIDSYVQKSARFMSRIMFSK